MKKITAVILTKNEEEMIGDCLVSVDFCDEIILIDSGSTDKTLEIAKKHKARVIYDSSFDFSQKRNSGASEATHDWILYVDADERVSPKLRESIEQEISRDNPENAYWVKRKNYYLGNHEWPKTESFLRLFQKRKLLQWEGKLHETAKVVGNTGTLDGFLIHFTHRDLSSMLQKTIAWSETEAMLRYDANHPNITWWRIPRVILTGFLHSYVKQQGYKVGTAGVIESIYQGFSMGITYMRLWELQQQDRVPTKSTRR